MDSSQPYAGQHPFVPVFFAYLLLAIVAISLSGSANPIAYWPANAVLIAWLSFTQPRQWILIGLAATLARIGAAQVCGTSLLQATAFMLVDFIEVATGTLLLRKFNVLHHFDDSPEMMMRLIGTACLVPSLTGGITGGAIISMMGEGAWSQQAPLWFTGSLFGYLSCLPLSLWIAKNGLQHFYRDHNFLKALIILLVITGFNSLGWLFLPSPPAVVTGTLVISAMYLENKFVYLMVITEAMLWSFANTSDPGLSAHQTHIDLIGTITRILFAFVPPLLLAASRKQNQLSQKEYQNSVSHFKTVFETMNEGLVIQHSDGTIIQANSAASTILGLKHEDLIGNNPLYPILNPLHEDGTAFPGATPPPIETLRTGEPCSNVIMGVETPVSDTKWIKINARPVSDHLSGERMVVCTFSDVTSERQAISELAKMEARFSGLLDSAPDAIITVSDDQHIVGANQTACQMFDYGVGELIGKNINILIPVELRTQHTRFFSEFGAEQSSGRRMGANRAVMGLRRDSSTFPMEVALAKINMKEGRFYMAIGRDITQRLQSETKLRQLSQAIDQSPTGVVITDLDARIEYVNHAYEALTGYSKSELIGKVFTLKRTAEGAASKFSAILACLEAGKVWRGEFIDRRANGENYHVFSLIAPIRDIHGNTINYVASAEDITERKRVGRELDAYREHLEDMVAARTQELVAAKTAAEQATRAKSAFLATMSHEIRTPLNAVIGFAHVLRNEISEPGQIEQLAKINTAAQHLLGVINDVLDFSKLEAGKIDIQMDIVAVADLLTYVKDLTLSRIGGKPVIVATHIAPDLPPNCISDRLRLGQILGNFASNAAKFTDWGKITLTAKKVSRDLREELIKFEVIDTGIGISKDQQALLFTPFTQADPSITRKYGGTGLGLALSRGLAAALGGTIGVESVAGAGSTFWLTVPLVKAEKGFNESRGALEGSMQEASMSQLLKGHVLVVDDNPMNQSLLQSLLPAIGLSCDCVSNGQEALDCCATKRFDLVLMDMQMPVMDGITATRLLRNLPATASMPVIAMTANAFIEDRASCLEAGMDDFLSKPLSPVKLHQILSKFLEPASTLAPLEPLAIPEQQSSPAAIIGTELGPLAKRLSSLDSIDIEKAWTYSGSNSSTLERMLQIFMTHHANLPAELEKSMSEGNRESAHRAAHTIKGAALSLGANALGLAAETIEKALRNNAPMPVDTDALNAEMQTLLAALNAGEIPLRT